MERKHSNLSAIALVAGLMAAMSGSARMQPRSRKPRTHVPMMVTSPPEAIRLWNEEVSARKAAKRPNELTKQERRRIVRFVGIRQHKKDCRANRIADRALAV
jgi:hypothetical protein